MSIPKPELNPDSPIPAECTGEKFLGTVGKQCTDALGDTTSIRCIDQAMIEWLSSLRFRGQFAQAKAAWESRIFSQQVDLHKQVGAQPKSEQHLPLVALTMQAWTPDTERWTGGQIRSPRAYANPEQTEIFIARWPTPILMTYQVDIWTKTRQDLRRLITSLMMKWQVHPTETFIRVDFPVYGEKIIPISLLRIDDTSDLETGEEIELRRATASLEVKGWIFKLPVRKKTICNTHIAVVDSTGDETFDQEAVESHYSDCENYTLSNNGATLDSVAELDPDEPRVLMTLSFGKSGLTATGP